jgi:tetratricopeptide (TPR) repeat protein
LLATQALCLKQAGRLQQAKPLSQEALDLRRQMLGPNDRAVALSLANHASLLTELGEFAEAARNVTAAESIYQAIADASYEPAIAVLRTKGLIAWLQGDWNQATAIWDDLNQRYARLKNITLRQYPFYHHDRARIALAKDNPTQALLHMQQMFSEAADYLQINAARLNLTELQATAAMAACQANQPALAIDWTRAIQASDLQQAPMHLRAHYRMALWECARAAGDAAAMQTLAEAIRADDALQPAGRALEVRARAERLDVR